MRVAFIGQQRSGKDTAGEAYAEWTKRRFFPNGYSGEHYSLATPLKELILAADGVLTRDRLQQIGTDAIRHADYDFWVKILRRELIEYNPGWAYVTDARFPNEVKMLAEQKFHLIGISAPNEDRWQRTNLTITEETWAKHEKHESEVAARAALLDATYVVKNDSSIPAFQRRLDKLFEELHANVT